MPRSPPCHSTAPPFFPGCGGPAIPSPDSDRRPSQNVNQLIHRHRRLLNQLHHGQQGLPLLRQKAKASVAQTPVLGLRLLKLERISAHLYPNPVSRLRLFLSDRFFFLTVKLLPGAPPPRRRGLRRPGAVAGRCALAAAILAHRLGFSARSLARHPLSTPPAQRFTGNEVGETDLDHDASSPPRSW